MLEFQEIQEFREVIRGILERRQAVDPTLTYTKIAQKMRVQRSYLSNVLQGRGSLTQDQIYLFCRTVGLSATEERYLGLLLELDRSVVEERKREIQEQLKALRQSSSGSHMNSMDVKITDDAIAKYYNDPNCPLCHMYLCIPVYARNPRSLAEKIGVTRNQLSEIFQVLENCQLIELKPEGVTVRESNMFLGREKPFAKTHALLFRLKAVEAFTKDRDKEGYYFTASFAATETIRNKLRSAWLRILEEASAEIVECEATDVYHLNMDFFKM